MMRKYFTYCSVLLALLCSHFSFAQLSPFKADNGLFGYKDATGKVVVTPKFQNALSFVDGYAAVVLNDQLGLIDPSGKEIVYFDKVGRLNQDLLLIVKDQKIGIMEIKTGKVVQHPRYQVIDLHGYYFLPYYIVELDGKKGLVDKATGKEVFPPVYDSIKSAGFKQEYYYLYQNGKIKILDEKGNPLPGTYDRVSRVQDESGLFKRDGKYWYILESGGNRGLMSESNVIVIPPRYSSIYLNFEKDGLAYVSYKGRHGMVNRDGEEIIKPQYDRRLYFSGEGISAASLNGRHGYIDKQGNIVIPFKYEAAGIFSEGLGRVKSKGKYGFIDRNNKWKISNKYEDADTFYNGLCPVKKKGKWGYINRNGKTVIPHKFTYAGSFLLGRAVVTDTNGTDYYIDMKGKLTKR